MRLKNIITTIMVAMALLLPAVMVTAQVGAAPKDQVLGGVKSVDSGDTDENSLSTGIKNIINIILYVAGAIAVVMIIIGGIRFVTSNGNPESVKAARNTVLYAAIGIVVILMAYAIVNFVITNIAGGNG